MATADEEQRLLSDVLEGLDDLYDRRERAEIWLARLLTATSLALRGTDWEQMMALAASALDDIRLERIVCDDPNTAALIATDELRQAIAAAEYGRSPPPVTDVPK